MSEIPEDYRDILGKRAFAHLATTMPDGSPQASPVWIDTDGGHLVVNSAKGRLKDKNMRADPRVAVSVTDPDNDYRCLMIRGRVVKITEEGAEEHIDKMAKKYMDVDRYPYRGPQEVRVLYYIAVEKVGTMG